MNAIAHIYDGGPPPARGGRGGRNTFVGFSIHSAASFWWALVFEALPRRYRDLKGAAGIAVLAYFVDYHVAHRRLRPGFERDLPLASLVVVYGALAAGFAGAAARSRA